MHRGFLSARINDGNPQHHLWNNNGTFWCHFVLHFDDRRRKRRIRRSLKTPDVEVAIARRDALFTMLATEGEDVPERPPRRRRPTDQEPPTLRVAPVPAPSIHP